MSLLPTLVVSVNVDFVRVSCRIQVVVVDGDACKVTFFDAVSSLTSYNQNIMRKENLAKDDD